MDLVAGLSHRVVMGFGVSEGGDGGDFLEFLDALLGEGGGHDEGGCVEVPEEAEHEFPCAIGVGMGFIEDDGGVSEGGEGEGAAALELEESEYGIDGAGDDFAAPDIEGVTGFGFLVVDEAADGFLSGFVGEGVSGDFLIGGKMPIGPEGWCLGVVSFEAGLGVEDIDQIGVEVVIEVVAKSFGGGTHGWVADEHFGVRGVVACPEECGEGFAETGACDAEGSGGGDGGHFLLEGVEVKGLDFLLDEAIEEVSWGLAEGVLEAVEDGIGGDLGDGAEDIGVDEEGGEEGGPAMVGELEGGGCLGEEFLDADHVLIDFRLSESTGEVGQGLVGWWLEVEGVGEFFEGELDLGVIEGNMEVGIATDPTANGRGFAVMSLDGDEDGGEIFLEIGFQEWLEPGLEFGG